MERRGHRNIKGSWLSTAVVGHIDICWSLTGCIEEEVANFSLRVGMGRTEGFGERFTEAVMTEHRVTIASTGHCVVGIRIEGCLGAADRTPVVSMVEGCTNVHKDR